MRSGSHIVLYTEAPVQGGVTAIVELLAKELNAVTPLTLVHSPNPALTSWAHSVQCSRAVAAALARTGSLPGWSMPGRVRQLLLVFNAARLVHFHLHTPFACAAAIALARFAGVPRIVATEHYIAQLPFLRRRRLVAPMAALREVRIAASLAIKRWSLRGIDDVVTLSNGNRSVFESFAGPRARPIVHVIHNGIDLHQFDAGPADEHKHPLHPGCGHLLVTTVAGLNNQKGHVYLIRAIPDILRAVPHARFLFVGDGHLRGDLEAMAASLGIARAVTFAGERPDVPLILASSDLVVLPSLFEGMPMSVLEAMAAGRAVVATDVAGTQDVVVSGQTGLLVPPEDPEALAGAIVELLLDAEKRQAFGRNGRRHVEQNFSAALMGERYRALFRETGMPGRP